MQILLVMISSRKELSRCKQTHQAELWTIAIMSYWSAAKLWRGILDKIVIRLGAVRHYIVLHGYVPGDTTVYRTRCVALSYKWRYHYVEPHAPISYPIMLYLNWCGAIYRNSDAIISHHMLLYHTR